MNDKVARVEFKCPECGNTMYVKVSLEGGRVPHHKCDCGIKWEVEVGLFNFTEYMKRRENE